MSAATINAAIELDTPTVRRDRWGRYLVLAPGATKPTGYTRATTVAKALDDTSNLMDWACRMTAIGLAKRADLLALVSTTPNDDRRALNGICERAKEAGGATLRRDLGTALHAMIEASHADPAYVAPDPYAADVAAVNAELAAHGFTVAAGMSERMIVMDRYGIAGTFDLILERDGISHIADIKTGSSIAYGGLGFAVQLATYANADHLYTQGEAKDGSQDIREPMPDVSKDIAIIIHVEPGSGSCDLHQLDIAQGAQALEIAMAVRTWRKAKVLTPLPTITSTAPDTESLTHSVASASPQLSVGGEHTTDAGRAGAPLTRREWCRDRVAAVLAHSTEAAATMVALWPEGVPPLKGDHPHTDAELDLLVAALDEAETVYSLSFPAPDPSIRIAEPTAIQVDPEPVPWVAPDEGRTMDDGDMDALRASVAKLAIGEQKTIQHWIHEGETEGRPWSTAELPSARRFECVRAAILLATMDLEDAREVIGLALGTELQPGHRTGMAIGAMTAAEASRAVEIARAAIDGTPLILPDVSPIAAA